MLAAALLVSAAAVLWQMTLAMVCGLPQRCACVEHQFLYVPLVLFF